MKITTRALTTLVLVTLMASQGVPAEITVVGRWSIRVTLSPSALSNGHAASNGSVELHVQRPEPTKIQAEYHEALPLFNPRAGGWSKGVRLYKLRATETTTPYLLDRDSLVVRAGDSADSKVFELDQDYQADLDWGTIGRVAGGDGPPHARPAQPLPHHFVSGDVVGVVVVQEGTRQARAERHPDQGQEREYAEKGSNPPSG